LSDKSSAGKKCSRNEKDTDCKGKNAPDILKGGVSAPKLYCSIFITNKLQTKVNKIIEFITFGVKMGVSWVCLCGFGNLGLCSSFFIRGHALEVASHQGQDCVHSEKLCVISFKCK